MVGKWKTFCKTCGRTRAWSGGSPITSGVFGIILRKLGWDNSEKGWVCSYCRGVLHD